MDEQMGSFSGIRGCFGDYWGDRRMQPRLVALMMYLEKKNTAWEKAQY